jgi:hypothetical protein
VQVLLEYVNAQIVVMNRQKPELYHVGIQNVLYVKLLFVDLNNKSNN